MSIIFTSFLLSALSVLQPEIKSIQLLDGLESNVIKAELISTGENSKYCVIAKIQNPSSYPISVNIPAGTFLQAQDPRMQDIIVTLPEEVYVQSGQMKEVSLYGFCSNASASVPAEQSTFIPKPCPIQGLLSLAEFMSLKKFDSEMQQAAIWSITNGHSVGAIWSNDSTSTNELRTMACSINRQPIPFYTLDYNYEPNTNFELAPITLKGEMVFHVGQKGKGSLYIFDPEGNIFATFYENREMKVGKHTQKFSYEGVDMMQGIYVAKMIVEGKLVSEQLIYV